MQHDIELLVTNNPELFHYFLYWSHCLCIDIVLHTPLVAIFLLLLHPPPVYIEVRHLVATTVAELNLLPVTFLLHFIVPKEDTSSTARHGNRNSSFLANTSINSEEENFCQLRVNGHDSHSLAQISQFIAFHCFEELKCFHCLAKCILIGGFYKIKLQYVSHPKLEKLQRCMGEMHPQNLRCCSLTQCLIDVRAVESITLSFAGTPGSPLSLFCWTLANGANFKRIHVLLWVKQELFHQSSVYDEFHAWNSDWCFSYICSKDNFAQPVVLEHLLLIIRLQFPMKG